MKKIPQAAIDSRKPKILYECDRYIISSIPRNYRIDIKKDCAPKNPRAGIDRDCYSMLENGLEYAKKMAEDVISTYFVYDKGDYKARKRANLKVGRNTV